MLQIEEIRIRFAVCVVLINNLLTAVHRSFGDVSNSGSLNNVTDDELFDGFVFWHATSTVRATNRLYMPAIVLATSSITALLGLMKIENL